ncbi:MAG TPA: DUF5990 family protein [Streptosporangiaceae bacterium]|nr:DUF5990 family protein [Streptosporangiaceae bacterium]
MTNDFLTADAAGLVDAQYADRPALRPVLDAILAAIPDMDDEVTIQPRKTIVSLVSPRRTFAVIQATTRTRVDLGLRLDGQEPGGRLLPARDLGAANVRIALEQPADFDREAIELLRRAYRESVAPPAPRARPAPRPRAADKTTITVLIEGSDLPGLICQPGNDDTRHENMHVALRATDKLRPGLTVIPASPWQATGVVPGDAPAARWEVPVTVASAADGYDFSGPYVRGDKTDRHIALVWGDVRADGTFRLVRGAKFKLGRIDPLLIQQVIESSGRLVTRVRLTDPKGNPSCAGVPGPDLTWSAGN